MSKKTKTTKTAKKQAEAKKAAKTKETKPTQAKRLSALDAAVKVLAETGTTMNAKELIEAMAAKKYWTSPGGQTPHSTLFAAIIREIAVKGKESRFKKTGPGQFAATAAA